MTKEEMVQFLKDDLEITIAYNVYGYTCVELTLCGETISESKDFITENDW